MNEGREAPRRAGQPLQRVLLNENAGHWAELKRDKMIVMLKMAGMSNFQEHQNISAMTHGT